MQNFRLISLLALTVLASVLAQTPNCPNIRIFLARGAGEDYPGRQSALVDAICTDLQPDTTCDYEDITYSAGFEPYCSAVAEGVKAGREQLTRFGEECPESRIVLSGFSQGAEVVGDILSGGNGDAPEERRVRPSGECVKQGDSWISPNDSLGQNIVGALLFGDIRQTGNQPYNVGTGAGHNGVWPRQGEVLDSLNRWSKILRSYCNVEDPLCAGGDNSDFHLNYFDAFSSEAGVWVREQIAKKNAGEV